MAKSIVPAFTPGLVAQVNSALFAQALERTKIDGLMSDVIAGALARSLPSAELLASMASSTRFTDALARPLPSAGLLASIASSTRFTDALARPLPSAGLLASIASSTQVASALSASLLEGFTAPRVSVGLAAALPPFSIADALPRFTITDVPSGSLGSVGRLFRDYSRDLAAAYVAELPRRALADAIADSLVPLTRPGSFGAPYGGASRAVANLVDALEPDELAATDRATEAALERAGATDEKLLSIGGFLDLRDRLRGSAAQVRASHVVIAALCGGSYFMTHLSTPDALPALVWDTVQLGATTFVALVGWWPREGSAPPDAAPGDESAE